ncbi:MAG: twin-arginine translocation signal domain-containing protein [Edaphobacter sp.]
MQDEKLKQYDKSASSAISDMTVTRRAFLGKAAATTVLAGLSTGAAVGAEPQVHAQRTTQSSTFIDLLRIPDYITAYSRLDDPLPLRRSGAEWQGKGVTIESRVGKEELAITVAAPGMPVKFIHVRWNAPVAKNLLALGDHWERSYGDLSWRNIVPERVMPWYFATYDGSVCNGYGVKTGAGSLCFWQLDPEGVSLWLNTANGGSGVQLGQRTLLAATVVTRKGSAGEEPTRAIHAFCQRMCSQPPLRTEPVYGTNDWYYAYGKNTAQQILKDTDFIAGLSVSNAARPFSVIDMGWADGSKAYGSMSRLASNIRDRKVRPGIWIRPLEAPAGTDSALLLSDIRFGPRKERSKELAYDPTIPESQEKILAKVKQVVNWGYELVKHDFSTYDLLGQWGFEMGAEPTVPGWSLHDPSRTNAEVILDLYRRIRETCGHKTLILGCNTVGHLAQGLFNIQRTGDDTSGRIWERTRRMGINTLAFRLPQHGSFFIQDADCVGISTAIPWRLNRQWLDLLAHTGTALIISPGEGARTPEHAQLIKEAFQLTAAGGDGAHPTSWRQESTPEEWEAFNSNGKSLAGRKLKYDWCSPTGAYPFPI